LRLVLFHVIFVETVAKSFREYQIMADNVLTIEEVANILRVSTGTVRKLIKDGKLKSFRVGLQIRVKQSDLDRYMQSSY
jgi:excisionase family DNA binding protein